MPLILSTCIIAIIVAGVQLFSYVAAAGPRDVIAGVGSTDSFNCDGDVPLCWTFQPSSPPGAHILPISVLAVDNPGKYDDTKNEASTNVLTVRSVQTSDAGIYECGKCHDATTDGERTQLTVIDNVDCELLTSYMSEEKLALEIDCKFDFNGTRAPALQCVPDTDHQLNVTSEVKQPSTQHVHYVNSVSVGPSASASALSFNCSVHFDNATHLHIWTSKAVKLSQTGSSSKNDLVQSQAIIWAMAVGMAMLVIVVIIMAICRIPVTRKHDADASAAETYTAGAGDVGRRRLNNNNNQQQPVERVFDYVYARVAPRSQRNVARRSDLAVSNPTYYEPEIDEPFSSPTTNELCAKFKSHTRDTYTEVDLPDDGGIPCKATHVMMSTAARWHLPYEEVEIASNETAPVEALNQRMTYAEIQDVPDIISASTPPKQVTSLYPSMRDDVVVMAPVARNVTSRPPAAVPVDAGQRSTYADIDETSCIAASGMRLLDSGLYESVSVAGHSQ